MASLKTWSVGLALLCACGSQEKGAADPSSVGAGGDTVHVAIANDGSMTFDGRRVDPADLTARARELTRNHRGLKFVLDAEREVSFLNVISAVERLRAGNAANVTFGSLLASTSVTSTPAAKAGGGAGVAAAGPEPRANVPAGTKWDCAFPLAAERGGKDEANVLVRVHVESDGRPLSVDVLEDPGGGFGNAAKKCAMDKAYEAPRDSTGKPIRATTFPFYIHFLTR